MDTQPPAGDPYRTGYERTERVIVTTGNEVAGYRIAGYLGIVRGIVVRSAGFTKSFVGSFRALAAATSRSSPSSARWLATRRTSR